MLSSVSASGPPANKLLDAPVATDLRCTIRVQSANDAFASCPKHQRCTFQHGPRQVVESERSVPTNLMLSYPVEIYYFAAHIAQGPKHNKLNIHRVESAVRVMMDEQLAIKRIINPSPHAHARQRQHITGIMASGNWGAAWSMPNRSTMLIVSASHLRSCQVACRSQMIDDQMICKLVKLARPPAAFAANIQRWLLAWRFVENVLRQVEAQVKTIGIRRSKWTYISNWLRGIEWGYQYEGGGHPAHIKARRLRQCIRLTRYFLDDLL